MVAKPLIGNTSYSKNFGGNSGSAQEIFMTDKFKIVETIQIKNSQEFRERLKKYFSFLKDFEEENSRKLWALIRRKVQPILRENVAISTVSRAQYSKKNEGEIPENLRIIRAMRGDLYDLFMAANARRSEVFEMSGDGRKQL